MTNAPIPTTAGLGLGGAVKSVFGKYAEFRGRATRSEYWYWVLFEALFGAVLGLALTITFFWAYGPALATAAKLADDSIDMAAVNPVGNILFWVLVAVAGLWWLITIVPTLAVTVRRFHDAGYTGWLWFLNLVPSIGSIVVLVFMVLPSTPGDNQFGLAPVKR